MSTGAYDGLFGKPTWGGTGRPWIEALSPEARDSVEELVGLVAAQGEPSWLAAHRIFTERFPEESPTHTTFKKTVRELVAARG